MRRILYDPAGALSMVAFDSEWQAYPGNITNVADVANGDPPDFRARPTYDRPADHPDDAAPDILAVHKRAMDRHQAYTTASSTLNVALLASVVSKLRTETTVPASTTQDTRQTEGR